ncbi:DeoR/GlpR family DNA-binding transcription regulator [Suttonella ornithocola]|uniref:HTH-type transcriptional repressor glcR n=1 Tax=Suttonella ornithocola TaxID=279832 RepID=A0A380MXT2_9GAMM|nr:DeoR/GlpR family DNA-binding transcription regulator [Suttonella ornithocola]SUO97092.1 HTH-type transcriptional repressor glcR [Suttonella ornithocola]
MKAETTVDRRAQIRQLLETNNVVSSQQLADRFQVSLMTIYRDLDNLQEQGIAKRQHGGAILANRFVSARLRGKRANENLDAKRAIGRYAARHLVNPDDDAIIISAGSTTLEFVRQLPDVPINVMANSLEALSILGTHTHTNLYALGGELRKDVMAFGGAMTHENLKQCHFAKAFIGVDGIDMESGFTSTNEQTARISRLMGEHAEQVYILTDSSKFDQKSFRTIFQFDAVDAIITNSGVPDRYKDFLKEHNVALIEVDKASEE